MKEHKKDRVTRRMDKTLEGTKQEKQEQKNREKQVINKGWLKRKMVGKKDWSDS